MFYSTPVILCVALISLVHKPTYYGMNNICGYHRRQPICCTGWRNKIGAPCTVAVCAGNCGDRGECIQPNVCRCGDGGLRSSCTEEDDVMLQDQGTPSCPNNCNNQGVCENGKCICDRGFRGISCQEVLKSACYTKLKRGLCVNPMQHPTSHYGNQTTMLTREECCNSFGIAWGQPCQSCVATYCGRGFHRVNGVCRDINECDTSGVCSRGQCINHDGSFTCKCPQGTKYDHDVLDCVYEKRQICARDPKLCSPNGKCVDLPNGDFYCACDPRYQLASDRKSCLSQYKFEFNICNLYQSSVCKNGFCIPRGYTYECSCNEGFEPSQDRKTCQYKIDICSVHRGYLCANGQCIPNGRDYYCQCNPGFVTSHDQRRCLSQCEQYGTGICTHGQCISLPSGDFECQCDQGYQSSLDRKQCIPITELESVGENEQKPFIYINKQPKNQQPVEIRAPSLEKSMDVIYARVQHDSISKRISKQSPMSPTSRYQPTILVQSSRHSSNQPPCSRPEIVAACHGGLCLNLGGDAYECECRPGYQNIQNKRMCLPRSGSETKNVWQNDDVTNETTLVIPSSPIGQKKLTVSLSGSAPKVYPLPVQTATIRSHRGPFIRPGHMSSPCDRKEISRQCHGGICLNLGGQAYKCECFEGYQPIASGKGCVKIGDDTNEPGWQSEDSGLRSQEPIGNYFVFQQPSPDPWIGYKYNSRVRARRSLLPQPCDQSSVRNQCQGGTCLNLGGNLHTCECVEGYQLSSDGRSCEKTKEAQSGNSTNCTFCSYGCAKPTNLSGVITCQCDKNGKFIPIGQTGICTESPTIVSGRIEKDKNEIQTYHLILKMSTDLNRNMVTVTDWKQFLEDHLEIVDQRIGTIVWTGCQLAADEKQTLKCPLLFKSKRGIKI